MFRLLSLIALSSFGRKIEQDEINLSPEVITDWIPEIDASKLNPPIKRTRKLEDVTVTEANSTQSVANDVADEFSDDEDKVDISALNDFYKQIVPFETAMF
jgi:hypothetical protein